jgi:hypothetical protein
MCRCRAAARGIDKVPFVPVTVDWPPISDADFAVTVTPGITPPWLSLTVPIRRPWSSCAHAGPPPSAYAKTASHTGAQASLRSLGSHRRVTHPLRGR